MMKRLILAIPLLVCGVGAAAASTPIANSKEHDEQKATWYCDAVAHAGEMGMRQRRNGRTLAETLAAMLRGVQEENRLMVYIPAVLDAYKGPVGVKAHDTNEYRAELMAKCMKGKGF